MASRESDDALFRSSSGMVRAVNYTDWTFSLFERHIRGHVLEVGCGVGTFTRRLLGHPLCEALLSIDVDPAAVEYCRRSIVGPRLELRVSDVRAIDGRFDLIVCMNVLEHIEDDVGALRHMLALLRPGGTLFLLVPAHPFLHSSFDTEAGHYRRYTKRALGALRETAGTAPLDVRQFYFNAVGAIGYFVQYKLLRKQPRADFSAEIGWFDRIVVPVMRRLERERAPFGISLVAVLTKRA